LVLGQDGNRQGDYHFGSHVAHASRNLPGDPGAEGDAQSG
jgi:hypothetical protein